MSTKTISATYASGFTLTMTYTTITSTGRATNTAASGKAVSGPAGTNWTLTNSGTVSETGTNGIGISFASTGTITNSSSGVISGGATKNSAAGIVLGGGGYVTNQSGGSISGYYGFEATGVATVVNAGSISGSPTAAHGIGVHLNDGGLVINQSGGTLTGNREGVLLTGGGVVSNASGGQITGSLRGVYASLVPVTVINAGSIGGNLTAGEGIYLYNGGTVTNLSTGLITGNYAVALQYGGTLVNAGTISGGQDAVTLGAGYTNRLVFDPGATFIGTVNGGNTIGPGSISTLELATGSGAGALSGLGSKYINFAQVTIDSGATWTLSGSNSGFATLVDGGTLINTGLITGASYGVVLANGAVLTNQSVGTIVGSVDGVSANSAGTVVNAGSIAGGTSPGIGVYLGGGGTLTNLSGGTISGGADAVKFGAGHTNRLVIAPSASFTGTVNGGNTISAASTSTLELASAAGAGALSGLGSKYINFAQVTIDSGATWTLSGSNSGFATLVDGGTLINAGLITGASYGVALGNGAVLTNQSAGIIVGRVEGVSANSAGTVVNAGSISGGVSPGIGVYLGGGGTLTNLSGGTISGGADAVKFGASHTNRLVIAPSASFSGTVDGGNAIGATSISTLELASGASAGTLTSLGSKYIHFRNITIDAGVVWSVASGSIGSGYTINDAGTLTNAAILGSGVTLGNGAQLTNASGGTITAASYAIVLAGGGYISNALGGTIAGYDGVSAGAAATVVNIGVVTGATTASVSGGAVTVHEGVHLGAGGNLTNQHGGIVSGFIGVLANGAATVVNGGSIAGAAASYYYSGKRYLAAGLELTAGGSVTNQSGGTISGYYGVYAKNSAAIVVNAGVIAGNYTSPAQHADGVYLRDGGTVTNQSTGTIFGRNDGVLISGARGTVVNLGSIHSHDSGDGSYGVELADGGVVINGTSGGTASAAYIRGYHNGVRFDSAASTTDTLINYGTISGTPGGVAVVMSTGVVINGRSGATGALITSGYQNNGVVIDGVGTVANYGTIAGIALNGETHVSYGVSVGGSGSVASSISNLGSNAVISGYLAVYAGQNDTVTNSGTLLSTQMFGGTAPYNAIIFGGGTNRLIIDPGAVFIGNVFGSGPVTLAPAGNTIVLGTTNGIGTTALELAAGTSAGTMSGLGTKYVGFASVTVDSGATWTFAGSDTLASGITLTDSGTATVTGTFANAGVITGVAKGIVLGTGGHITNQSGGTITGPTNGVGGSGAGTVVNYGSISANVTTSGDAGVNLSGGGTVVNHSGGTISGYYGVYGGSSSAATVTNAGSIGGNTSTGIGVYLRGGGTLTNQAGGAISGGADAVKFGASHTNRLVIQPSAAFVGMIDGGNTIGAASISTLELASSASAGTLAGLGSTIVNFAQVTVDSGGTWTLSGTSSGFSTLTNAGKLQAGVTLGSGSLTVSNVSGGTISNTSASGTALSATGTLAVVNAGSIGGGTRTGIGVYLGGGGTLTNKASGVISGGTYAVKFGAGHTNRLAIAQGASFSGTVNGGNTIGAAYTSSLELLSSASAGTFSGLGSSLVNFAALTIDSGATWTLSGTISGLSSLQNAGGRLLSGVTLGSGSFTATNASTGAITNTNTGVAAFYASGALSMANAGTIDDAAASGIGIDLAGGGTLTNQSTGRIIGSADAVLFGASHTNKLVVAPAASFTGKVDGGNTIGASYVSTLELASSGSVGALTSLGSQFVNFAQITIDSGARWSLISTNSLVSGATLTNSGTLTNTGIFTNAGLITGTNAGIALNSSSRLTNQSSGAITGGTIGVTAVGAATVVNAGSIGGATPAGGRGVLLSAGGVVSNQSGGSISGNYGVYATGASAATITNAGAITGGSSSGIGVFLHAGGTLSNQAGGSISGTADAVKFGVSHTNRLVVAPSASFSGLVDGGNTIGAVSTSTLELASAASIGTLNGFGSNYVNFAQITLDTGARWNIVGSSTTTALAGATISGFAADTIDITDFAATASNFGSNELTLNNSASSMTLNLPGSFASGQFAITNDGGSGTDIFLWRIGETIVQRGILATSETVNAGTMTLFNSGGTAVGSIAVGVSLGTGDFSVSNNGTNSYIVVNSAFGTYSSGLTITNSPATITSSGLVQNTANSAVALTDLASANWTLVNAGVIAETATGGIAITAAQSGNISNASGGTIAGGGSAIKLNNAVIINNGLISQTTTAGNHAIDMLGGQITNQAGGLITGQYGVWALAGATMAVTNFGSIVAASNTVNDRTGIYLFGGGSILNQSGALISGVFGIQDSGTALTLVNAGTISGLPIRGSGNGPPAAIYTAAGGSVTNQSGGLITGYQGFWAVDTALTIVNAGSIGGNATAGLGVLLAAGGTVTSSGTITGGTDAVTIGASHTGRVVIDPGAVFVGKVDGGNTIGAASISTLELASGASTGTLTSLGSKYLHFANITVDAGASWTLASASIGSGYTINDAGTLTNAGTLGSEVTLGAGAVLTNASGGTITTNGTAVYASGVATVVNAGSIGGGTSTGIGVYLSSGGTLTNQGGGVISGGADAVKFGTSHSNLLVVAPSASFTGTVNGGNTIGAASISTLELASAGSAGTLSGLGTQFVNFAQVTIDGGATWTLSGTNTGFATLTNAGTVATGIKLGSGTLTVSNQSGGTITGYYGVSASAAATVGNTGNIAGSGSYAAGVRVQAGGLVSNQSGGMISGANAVIAGAGALTVVNAGSLAGSQAAYSGDAGVALDDGGLLTNQTSGIITGDYAVNGLTAPVTIINAGTIAGISGAELDAPALVTNQSGGTISGSHLGVHVFNNTGTVVNAGIIAGTTYYGIQLATGGTVANQSGGTISGGIDAVKFGAGHTNRLIIAPSASFSGTVDGGNTIGATSISTLELATGASAGTLSGLGSKYINFAQVAIDSGAQWRLSGGNTLASAVTMVDAGTLTNTGSFVVDPPMTVTGTFINSSIVSAPGTYTAIYVAAGGVVTNSTGATISAGGDAITAAGTVSITNFGKITAQTNGIVIGGSAAVVNDAGYIGAGNGGVYLTAGGTISVGSSGTIDAIGGDDILVSNGAGTITNNGQLLSTFGYGINLGAGGSIKNAGTISSKQGVYAALTASTINNTGEITASSGPAVRMQDGGLLTNGGTLSGTIGVVAHGAAALTIVDTGAIIGSSGTAVAFGTANDLLQFQVSTSAFIQGTVNGGSGSSTLEFASAIGAGTLTGANADFVNFSQGTIDSGAQWLLGSGVTLTESGALTDSGTLTNTGQINGNGIVLTTGAAITNLSGGTITGSPDAIYGNSAAAVAVVNAGYIDATGFGVEINGVGSVTNQSGGTIKGGTYAVSFAAGYTNDLVIDPGAVFIGKVSGGNTIGANHTSTLELASGASAATLNSLGAQFVDFAQVTVDANATWTLGGTINGFATLANAGTLQSGVTLGSGSFTVSNQSGGTISGGSGIKSSGTATVVNAGGISGNATIVDSAGVYLLGGGSVTNQSGGVIAGLDGVYAKTGAASVTNRGTISGNSTNGIGVLLTAGGAVSNASGGLLSGASAAKISGTAGSVGNAGSIGGGLYGVYVVAGGSVTNQSGGTITGNNAAIKAAGTVTVVNTGNIAGNVTNGIGVSLTAGGWVSNHSAGEISGGAYGIKAVGVAATVVNAGSITGSSGVYLAAGGAVTDQSGGTITGGNGIKAAGTTAAVINAGNISGSSDGVYLLAGGSVTNQTSGAISGVVAFYAKTDAATLINSGYIIGNSTNGAGASLAAGGYVSNQSGGTISGAFGVHATGAAVAVVNAGSIIGNATYAVAAVDLGAGGSVTNQSGGLISGFRGISISSTTASTVVNFGSIAGNATFGAGVYLYTYGSTYGALTNQSGGTVTGFRAVDAVSVVNYGMLAGNATFGAGVYLPVGGSVTNHSGGTITGYDGVDGSCGCAEVVNYGVISADATRGFGVYLLEGGSLTNRSGGTVTGLEGVFAKYSYATVVNAGYISGNSTKGLGVLLGMGGVVSNQSGGTISGYIGIGASSVVTVVNGGRIAGGTTATANGTITHVPVGVYLRRGGLITNQSGGTISGFRGIEAVRTAASTIVNTGYIGGGTASFSNSSAGTLAIAAGVYFTAGGTLSNQSGGTIKGFDGVLSAQGTAAATVVNAGTIDGSQTATSGIGIALYAGGWLSNQSGGTITGYRGVVATGTATLLNAGYVGGIGTGVYLAGTSSLTNSSGGAIQGANAVAGQIGSSSTIINNASLIATGSIGYGVVLQSSGSVTNTGLISAAGTHASGVVIKTGGAVSNASGGTITAGNFGVYISGGGTVINAGAIDGAIAVAFGSTSANLLVLDPGASFSGLVTGGNAIGSSIVSTLELASGSNSGTLSGLGGKYIDFAKVTIDSGATWTLSTSNAVASGVTLNNAGTLTASGTLDNYGAVIGASTALYLASGSYLKNGASAAITGTNGLAAVLAETGTATSTVVNAGAITGGPTASASGSLTTAPVGLSFAGAGFVTNKSGGTISGFDAVEIAGTAATVINAGDIAGGASTLSNTVSHHVAVGAGVYLRAGGYVSNQSSGTITGIDGVLVKGQAGTVVNAGTISDSAAPRAAGVDLFAGGSVTNQATALISGVIGVVALGSATVTNAGGIVGTGSRTGGIYLGSGGAITNRSGGSITGYYGIYASGPVSVANAGTISGSLTGTNAYGISLYGTLTNQSGGAITGFRGVVAAGPSADMMAVVNAGSIGGNATSGIGVALLSTAIVTDQSGGTISGGADAVKFAAGFTNRLVVDPGAALVGTVDGGNTISASSISTLEFATGTSGGTFSGLGSKYIHFEQITIDSGASWTLTGTNTLAAGYAVNNAGSLTLSGATLSDGTALANNGGILLDPSTMTLAGLIGTGGVTLSNASTMDVLGTVSNGETISFSGGGLLDLGTPGAMSGMVTGFTAGDTIDLAGVNPASVTYASGALDFVANGTSSSFAFATTGSIHAVSDNNGGALVLCFCAGSRIATPSGEVPVEQLHIGDLVTTVHGEARPIVWIGCGQVLATRGRRTAATPVIVRKGALGDNVPHRDLHVTKGHAIFIDGVLIPVEELVNHRSILWDDRAQEVSIYHIELETHDVLLANGAPAESYRDDGNRWLFRNANSGWDHEPQPPCVPVLTSGSIVDAIWQRLLDRAGPRPALPMTDDPDLQLIVDGRRIDPKSAAGDWRVFKLPSRPQSVRLVSDTVVPQEQWLARDPRCLGVAVRKLVLSQGARIRVIEADDPLLTEGFHAFEPEAAIRWTDGSASLPDQLFDGFNGPLTLELQLGATTCYPLVGQSHARAA